MLLSHSFRSWKSRSLRAVVQLAYNSTQATPASNTVGWVALTERGSNHTKTLRRLAYDAGFIAMQKKRKLDHGRFKKNKKEVNPSIHNREGTNEEVLEFEVRDLLSRITLDSVNEVDQNGDQDAASKVPSESSKANPRLEMFKEYEVDIIALSSTGDGMAYSPSGDQVMLVPFTTPGDTVIARPHKGSGLYVHSDFVKVVKPSSFREGITPKCEYFAECSGCQLQMMSYKDQLIHKKTIVEKAFKYFSGLRADQLPAVEDTMGSPLQYGYRTKLTPHFSVPRSVSKTGKPLTEVPPIGFNRKGKSADGHLVMDIEHCPIGTEILQEGLRLERAKVKENIGRYKNGATVLLRESTKRTQKPEPSEGGDNDKSNNSSPQSLEFDSPSISEELTHQPDGIPEFKVTYPTHTDHKTYTSSEVSMTTEYVGPFKFNNRAGSFFQNNNSILRPFTSYIYEKCIPKPSSSSDTKTEPSQIKYLLDAYCGSGLFTITLSPIFSSALGIDIDRRGIEAARLNAEVNNIPNAGFIDADATDLFADVPYPPDQSLVVIDPPRKGASADFLRQLCEFGAKRVIYVSCNVHTQARDVGMIVEGFGSGWRYEIESLRGFDFFPQTGHVEGVCVLNRVEE